jgi:hypothetical protein
MKMKKLMAICAVVTMILVLSGVAQATLSWQTAPILGYSSYDNGDVVVVTATGLVTIPHYSMVGDPLYGVGGPGVSTFNIGETVANGSGINVLLGQTYHVVGVYNFLGASPRSLVSDLFDYTATSSDNFVMNYSYISDPAPYGAVYHFVAADVGNWTYNETWTNNADSLDTITSIAYFKVVPEPATIALLGLGALSLISRKRRA